MIECTIELSRKKKIRKRIPIIGISLKKIIKIKYICKKEGKKNDEFDPYGDPVDASFGTISSFLCGGKSWSRWYDKLKEKWVYNIKYELIDENKETLFLQRLKEDGWKIELVDNSLKNILKNFFML